MAGDIFHKSKSDITEEITRLVAEDQRSLPGKAKIFAAVARLQGFDALPDIADPSKLTAMARNGSLELQRGISTSAGIPARVFAGDLVGGPLFPGTLTAFGQGIYLAETSQDNTKNEHFPRLSQTAREYAGKGLPGMIVRCVLKPDANLQDKDEVSKFLRENKNRYKDVFGILDVGTFAASLGIDGYFCEGIGEHSHEKTWVILNRRVLVFQTIGLQINTPIPTVKT